MTPALDDYGLGVTAMMAGDDAEAVRCFRRALDGQELLVWHQSMSTQVTALRARIKRALTAWRQGEIPEPDYLLCQKPETAGWERYRDQKILFALPQYVRGNASYIESPVRNVFFDTAVNAGLNAEFFAIDSIQNINNEGINQAGSREKAAALLAHATRDSVGVLFFSCNEIGHPEGLGVELIEAIRAAAGCQVIGVMGDAWGRHSVDIARYWAPVCDLIYHYAPYSPLTKSISLAGKVWLGAPLTNQRVFRSEPERTVDLFFSGTCANHLRPFWLSVARLTARRRRLIHHLTCHDRRNSDSIPATAAEYAAALRSARAVINFSSRDASSKAMTGRPWQGMTSGCLVLEEANPFLAAYAVPDVHYLPFATAQQLAVGITLCATDPDLIGEIAGNAAAFMAGRYSETILWRQILAALAHRSQ